MDTAGQVGSGRLRFHKRRNAQAWTSTSSLITQGVFLPVKRKLLPEATPLRKGERQAPYWARFPSVRQTKQAGSVLEAGAWITHCMLGKELCV